MAQERELTTSVDTMAQTEQALKRLDGLESNAQVSQHLQRAALIHWLCTQMNSSQTHILYSSVCVGLKCVCGSLLALSGGDDPSSDHHPSRTPAVSRSPLRHGSDYAALQRTSPLL